MNESIIFNLQGFRYELTQSRKIFGSYDPVSPLSEMVFSALELLMADCVLSTEPSTNAILVTNNLFQYVFNLLIFGTLQQTMKLISFRMNCGALARGVVFKDFDVQVFPPSSFHPFIPLLFSRSSQKRQQNIFNRSFVHIVFFNNLPLSHPFPQLLFLLWNPPLGQRGPMPPITVWDHPVSI